MTLTVSALSSGTTFTIPDNNEFQVVDVTGNTSANSVMTITLPASPVDQQVTSISIYAVSGTGPSSVGAALAAPNSGQSLSGGTSFFKSASAGAAAGADAASFLYNSSNTTWYRVA